MLYPSPHLLPAVLVSTSAVMMQQTALLTCVCAATDELMDLVEAAQKEKVRLQNKVRSLGFWLSLCFIETLQLAHAIGPSPEGHLLVRVCE